MSTPVDGFHCEFSVGKEIVTITVAERNTWDARKAAWNDLRDALTPQDYDRAVLRSVSRVRIPDPPIEPNWARNQEEWDKGGRNISLEDCHRKGAEHKAYNWSRRGLGFPSTDAQQSAYLDGYDGKPLT